MKTSVMLNSRTTRYETNGGFKNNIMEHIDNRSHTLFSLRVFQLLMDKVLV